MTAAPTPTAPADDTWRQEAACREYPVGRDWDPWHPDKGVGGTIAEAKAVCNGRDGNPPCPVRMQCLGDAIDKGDWYGIRGGLTEGERRQLVRGDLRDPDECTVPDTGTHAGYKQHQALGEKACRACKRGNASYRRSLQRKRGVRPVEQVRKERKTRAVETLGAFESALDAGLTPAASVQEIGAQSANALGRMAYRNGRPDLGRIADTVRRRAVAENGDTKAQQDARLGDLAAAIGTRRNVS